MITKSISVPIEGRCLLFETASLSVLGCDHDVTEPRSPSAVAAAPPPQVLGD